MKLPIGYSDFKKIIDSKFDFVDKTLFIKEIIDDVEVILITRPRRFGKTLNMSMLQYFFANEVHGQPTKDLFKNLNIVNVDESYLQYQCKYPVIFLTFKDIKDSTFELAYEKIHELIIKTYDYFSYLKDSSLLSPNQKNFYQIILNREANQAQLENALLMLTECLFKHHGQKPIILIDEYDTPIQSGYLYDYYNDIVGFLRSFFGAGLKDNPFLFKSVLTGILRVSKESLFSGLNNLKSYSMLHPKYAPYFGFTESEVESLLDKANLNDRANEFKRWYNGYQIGDCVLYNPWSIVNSIQDQSFKPYWVNTSDNALVKQLLLTSGAAFKNRLELLLSGRIVERIIDENFVFPDLKKNNESAVWTLLLMAGYLKVVSYDDTDQGPLCHLAIPNQEIRNLYRKIIEQWLANGYGVEWYNEFLDYLLTGNMQEFSQGLTHILEQTVSVHDVACEPEAFYHGLMIGLTASLYGHPNYETRSNRESGHGRYDYMIISRDKNKLTILLEFKKITFPASKNNPDEVTFIFDNAAHEALEQMDRQSYLAEAKQRGINNILQIGIAFSGKRFGMAHKRLSDLTDKIIQYA